MSGADQALGCEHARCGGCALLHLPAGEQLERKHGHVVAAFAAYREVQGVEVMPLMAADPAFGYRRRGKLVVGRDGAIGLYARGTHEVDIPNCRVLAPQLMAVVAEVRARMAAQRVPLQGLDVREVQSAQGEGVLVTLLGDVRDADALTAFGGELETVDGVLGVALSVREARAVQLLGETPVQIAGVEIAADTLTQGGPYHYATYGAFVQAHRGQAQAIAERVCGALQSALGTLQHSRVLELYAGSGTLGLELAQRGALVVLVERYEPALALAARAAEEQGLAGVATRAGDADHVLSDLLRAQARDGLPRAQALDGLPRAQALDGLPRAQARFDAVVVNPPRRGLTPTVRRGIAQLRPSAIVYVSCDPGTLARDLADFARLGFSATQAQPFDMLPQSDDVECVVCLLPSAPAALHILHEDEELLVVDKPPHMPTIPEAEYPHSVLEVLRAQRSLSELHAVHRLDVGTSGVCLFSKHSARVAGLAAALAAGQKRYVALARGITHNKGIVKVPLRDDGKPREATTRFTRKSVIGGHSLLQVRPEQGRLHQVRRHLASVNHPVLGDARYGDEPSNRHFEHKHGLERAFLHLARIELVHPGTNQPLILEAPLAGDLQAVLASLKSG